MYIIGLEGNHIHTILLHITCFFGKWVSDYKNNDWCISCVHIIRTMNIYFMMIYLEFA